jgi:methylated-DNA-protein-cysteine methyltransferase-like protein
MLLEKDFYAKVFDVVKLIPKGRATSYGAIAKYLGAARSSRVVGWAMSQSIKNDPTIPAHRVANRLGMLSGKVHFETPDTMQEKLETEGVVVVKDQIQNWNSVFWDPEVELDL